MGFSKSTEAGLCLLTSGSQLGWRKQSVGSRRGIDCGHRQVLKENSLIGSRDGPYRSQAVEEMVGVIGFVDGANLT
jgi:hypothetical protein